MLVLSSFATFLTGDEQAAVEIFKVKSVICLYTSHQQAQSHLKIVLQTSGLC